MLSAAEQYIFLYNILLLIVIFTVFNYLPKDNSYLPNALINKNLAILLLIFMIAIIAWRDWESPLFGDSHGYGVALSQIQNGRTDVWDDGGFNWICIIWVKMGLPTELFFFLTASIYCIPMFWVAKRLDTHYMFLILLFWATSFSFYGFGVNGIRNGMASSLFLLAMTFKDRKFILALLLLIGLSFHHAMMLSILTILTASFYKKTSVYFKIWVSCIIVSFFTGRYFQDLFLNLGIVSDVGSGYLSSGGDISDAKFSHTGFRWDFLLYSAAPVVLGYYVIRIKKKSDDMYAFFLNTYLLCNSFWILVITANYSNRIAYLSWFLIPIVMVYPIVKFDSFKYKNVAISVILLTYYAFTYLIWIIK